MFQDSITFYKEYKIKSANFWLNWTLLDVINEIYSDFDLLNLLQAL